MWVSTKAQYGLRALVEVALDGNGPVSLKTVAERQLLSQQYLEQLFGVLRRAGIVESVRGAHGGYKLARPAEEIDALEVVQLLEGGLAPVACLEEDLGCDRVGHCSTESLWRKVDSAVRSVLGSVSLGDLVAERRSLFPTHPDALPMAAGWAGIGDDAR